MEFRANAEDREEVTKPRELFGTPAKKTKQKNQKNKTFKGTVGEISYSATIGKTELKTERRGKLGKAKQCSRPLRTSANSLVHQQFCRLFPTTDLRPSHCQPAPPVGEGK